MVSPTLSPHNSAMRVAMLRVANLRGSSMMIFLPCNQTASNKVNGNKVLLPAPGGAFTIRVLFSDKCCFTSLMISATGNWYEYGSKDKCVINKMNASLMKICGAIRKLFRI